MQVKSTVRAKLSVTNLTGQLECDWQKFCKITFQVVLSKRSIWALDQMDV